MFSSATAHFGVRLRDPARKNALAPSINLITTTISIPHKEAVRGTCGTHPVIPIEIAVDQAKKRSNDMNEKLEAEVARLRRDAATIEARREQTMRTILWWMAFRAQIPTMLGLED